MIFIIKYQNWQKIHRKNRYLNGDEVTLPDEIRELEKKIKRRERYKDDGVALSGEIRKLKKRIKQLEKYGKCYTLSDSNDSNDSYNSDDYY